MTTDIGNEEEFRDEIEEEPNSDIFDCVTENGYFHKLSSVSKSFLVIMLIIVVSMILYGWDGEVAEEETMEAIVRKSDPVASPTLPGTEEPVPTPTDPPENLAGMGNCDDICDMLQKNRTEKFKGDLLEPKDLLRLAKAARDETLESMKNDYGEYFDHIFTVPVNQSDPDAGRKYDGMEGVTPDGPSADRLKRKLKLKVLKMTNAVRKAESNVNGCDCINGGGSVNGEIDESTLQPRSFYEKYVFANGGHSQAAGHGNMYNETYTAYFGKDVRRIWESIGIEFEDRNYASGGMKASPYFSVCSKEVYGIDVDLLSWNFGMTDKQMESVAFYAYRGATAPGRPAIVFIEENGQVKGVGIPLEERGLAVFKTGLFGKSVFKRLPDAMPDGIQVSNEELAKLPEYVRAIKCSNRFEGGKICQDLKWSCNGRKKNEGSDCICPHVGKRSSWHMGYKMHALQGHLMSLPFMDLLIEGLEEIAESTKGTEALLEELEAEESKDYKQFFEAPLPMQTVNFKKQFENLMKTEGLLETIMKDPSVCRTSLVPSQTRYLGLSTNSDKIGGPQVGWNETYDLGIPLFVTDGVYSWEEGNEPIPGIVQQTSKLQDRQTSEEWQEECPAVTMPDYKDWLYGPLKDGKTKLTFPNEKEKAYYGYDPSKFKGIVGIVPTIWTENHCKKCPETDIRLTRFPEHVTTTVNGKVANFRFFNSMAILEDEAGSIYWDPSENQDYVIEFEPHGEIEGFPAVEHHLRFYGVVIY